MPVPVPMMCLGPPRHRTALPRTICSRTVMSALRMTPLRELARGFASGVRRSTNRGRAVRRAAPPPAIRAADQWTEVKDEATGLVYYWNERTDETTALGEPKPGPEGTSAFGGVVLRHHVGELPPCAAANRMRVTNRT